MKLRLLPHGEGRPPWRQPGWVRLAGISLLLGCTAVGLFAKPIRLRNELISTPDRKASAPAAAASARNGNTSELVIVQFEGPLTPQSRAQLARLGVDLLHYVPEDAFIARLRGVSPQFLNGLPFVHWVGDYRPEHKLHASLQQRMKALAKAEPLAVSVLLAPRLRPGELQAARQTFASVLHESALRHGTLLRGKVAPGQLQTLTGSSAVLWIEPAPTFKLVDEVASKIVAGDGGPGLLLTQVLGYDGSGVAVAVADTGLNNGKAESMHPDLLGRTPSFFFYGQLTDAADEHGHGTHVAGIVAGNAATGERDENGALYGLGVAPGAEIITQRIFDGAGAEQLPPSFERLTRDATRAGAVIGSNSWGDDNQGRYDTSAMEFDELVRDADRLQTGDQPYILEFSAGNAGPGPQTIGTPAVAKNVLSTGASENDRPDLLIYADGIDAVADFSSRGPCEDGRIKPDVLAPGTWIASLKSASATDENAWSPISDNYFYMGGTSQAGPHASGAAAVFVQYYRQTHGGTTPSPALVKAALINSATDMDDAFGTGPVPNMDEGWGRIDLVNLLDSQVPVQFLDQTVLLTNSQVYETHLLLANRDLPLKITLAYTDVPGFPGAVPALVNDLDLEVTAPDGTVYRGNQFSNGQSLPNPQANDTINNVEGVHLASPQPGDYRLRVRARNVVQDAREDTAAIDQDFALVISGNIAKRGTGEVSLDRAVYTAPDTIKLTLVDTDLAGQASAEVSIRSTTEASDEKVLLLAAGNAGAFTGAVATVRGPAVPDGTLQVANNDSIEVRYNDASLSVVRTATARVDLVPPVLSAPTATPSFGTVVIAWTSDEPANSAVYLGTNASNASLTNSVVLPNLVGAHSVPTSGLIPGATYYYFVVSADEAGNVTTNNNNGAFFTFLAPTTPPVLMVDLYQGDLLDAPPVSGYTDALNQLGINYDFYDGVTLGSPSLEMLRAYAAVIFRVPEFSLAWTAADLGAISNYIQGGGSMLLSSMEVLSRLKDGGFTSFISSVLQVQGYLTDENGSMGAEQVVGIPNDPIGTGLNISMDYTPYNDAWPLLFEVYGSCDISDALTTTPKASPCLLNDYNQVVGLRWQGPDFNSGRLVFLSFPLDAVPLSGGVNDRVQLLRRILSFLVPQAPHLENLTLDSSAYTLPSVVSIQLGDARLAGRGSVNAKATIATSPAGITVPLRETTRKGLFFGSFDLLPLTNSPGPTQLCATNGDTVQVTYMDLDLGINLSVSAGIDTEPPKLSNVAAEPDYITANISWESSEEVSDSLVQYGESPLLGETAYDSAPTLRHQLTLRQLAPDRLYYYRVVSRDLAGNVGVDDNGGKLYTFTTLKPLFAPWSDDMNSGATNWTVLTADGSQAGWTLGTPSGGGQPTAHSPPDAWGSNLNGNFIDAAETLLVSPPLQLANGNSATLSFWHWYDFTDTSGEGYNIEMGDVEIVVDNGPPQQISRTYADVSGAWVQEEIDLTPYMGKLVYFVWHYFLFAIDSYPRPGWLVDDVAVSISQGSAGTISISNNLSEATWVLSGRTYAEGKGFGTVLTNAGPGQYILEFGDVPFYTTPAPQTNTLASGGKIAFQGIYTFTDVNSNSIPDAWETKYFGSVSPDRTASTDTDHDGMSDYAEFVAGTDPTNPQSNLDISPTLLSRGLLNLTWQGATGRSYRIEGSTNGVTWTPYSDWLYSSSTNSLTVQVPRPGAGASYMFRVRVVP